MKLNTKNIKLIRSSGLIRPKLEKLRDRWYIFTDNVGLAFECETHVINYKILKGFTFDGRSGGKKLDWYAPHLGSEEEIICWLIHDLNAYDCCLDVKSTNEMLYNMLIASPKPKYRKIKAWFIKQCVTIANIFDPWFGLPDKDSPDFATEAINYQYFQIFVEEKRSK